MSGSYSLGTIRGTIKIDYDGAGIKKANDDVSQLKKSGVSTQESLKTASRTLAIGGLAIAGGLAVAVKSATNFQKGLSEIQAVSGATGAQMDLIRAKALKLGADTAFSASDAAGAMQELVKAGISVHDVLNGAADATVALAAAGGVSLPEAATIAANAMNQFGLSAQQMPKIADLIAGAANASAIDVGQFGQSMQQAGAVAHLAGLSFSDTAVAIAEMGNAGIKGSDAGTSLKTFLQNLIPQTKQQTQLMEKLGLITKNGGNAFFDASGHVKSLADVSQTLQTALKGMTKEQQLSTLQTLFGSDAIRAAAVLADNGAAGFNKLSASMGKVTAADVAAQRMNNLSGEIEQLKGSAETFAIQIGTILIPKLTDLAKKATELFNWFSGLSNGWKQTIITTAGLVAAFLLVGSAVVKIVEIVKAFRVAWVALNAGFIFTPIGAIITLIVLLVAAFVILWTRSAAFRNFWIGLWNSIWGFMKAIGAWFAGPFVNFFVSVWNGIVSVFSAIGSFFVGVWNGIVAVFTPIVAFFVGLWNGVVAVFRGVVGVISAVLSVFAPIFVAVFGLIRAIVQTTIAIILAVVAVGMALFRTFILQPLQAIWNGFVIIFNGIRSVVVAVFGFLAPYISAVWGFIVAFLTAEWNIIRAVATAIWSGLSAVFTAVWSAVRAVTVAVWGFIAPYLAGLWNGMRAVASAAFNGVRAIASAVWSAIVAIIRGAVATVVGIINGISAIVSAVGRFFGQLRTAAQGGTGSLIAFVAGIPGRVLGAIGNLGSLLYNAGVSIVQGLINGIKAMAGRVASAVSGVLSAARNLLPFSPAKEGPFSGKGWTLYSGMSMMTALAKGITATADLPVQALAGVLGSAHTPFGSPTGLGGSQTTSSSTNITGPSIGSVTVNVPAPITDPNNIATYTAQKISTALSTATTRRG